MHPIIVIGYFGFICFVGLLLWVLFSPKRTQAQEPVQQPPVVVKKEGTPSTPSVPRTASSHNGLKLLALLGSCALTFVFPIVGMVLTAVLILLFGWDFPIFGGGCNCNHIDRS